MLSRQAGEEVSAVVMGGDAGARAQRLAAEAAARAGLPLLLTGPEPSGAEWEALALYPHPDVLAMVILLHLNGPIRYHC